MLTTVSFSRRRNSADCVSSQPIKLVAKETYNGFYDSNQITIQSNSSSKKRIHSIVKEVNSKRQIRKRLESNQSSIFEFLNHKTKLYKRKFKVYNFFNKPQTFWAIIYHVLVFILVFGCLIVTVFSTIERFALESTKLLIMLEKLIIIWFVSEFILRLWSSSCKRRYQGWKGKFKYLIVPSHLLDITVIILSIIVLIINTRSGSEIFAVSAFRGFHRFLQVFQIITLNRMIKPWKLLFNVIKDQSHQLLIILYIEFVLVCILAYVSYMLEKDENKQFDNIAEAMWWAVITLSTVGYGDRVHITWLGKLISSLFTIIGVAVFALPAGIIGAGLAIRLEEEECKRLRKKKKLAAIVLIQCMWRCYKANQNVSISQFRNKKKNLFILNSFERIATEFINLTKFSIAKSKFKCYLRNLDLKNAFDSYRINQINVKNETIHIYNAIDIIGKNVMAHENQINDNQSSLVSRVEKIDLLINDIENHFNRQLTSINEVFAKLDIFINKSKRSFINKTGSKSF